MQKIASTLLGISLVFLVIFSTGCGEDGPIGGNTNLPPTISLASDAGFISFDQSVSLALPTFSVRVNMDDGDNPLSSLAITQNGVTIPPSNLVFDGGATTSQNPILILGADQSGTTYDIDITPVSPVANASSVFVFTVTDSERLTASTSVTITFASTPATVTFGAAGLSADATVSTVNPSFNLDVMANRGDAALTSIAFYENNVLLDAAEVHVLNAANPIAANPLAITPAGDLFNVIYTITPATPTDGIRTYTVEVIDALGVAASQSITITYATPEVTELNGVLLNQGGETGTGGLDLDNGTGTGSNNAAAEIQDEGLNTNLTIPNNWRRQISGANNAVLRKVSAASLPEGNFGGVTTLAQVRTAFEMGSVPAGADAPCACHTDSVSGEEVSEPVVVGDLFAVERDGNYYLIRVDAVNVTTNNNMDNYVLSIKK